jgi:micrococcal nuclease
MNYIRHCTLHRVIDGDTLDVVVDLGFRRFSRERIRLAGIDAPEPKGPTAAQGTEATEFVKEWCAKASDSGPLILDSHRADSFGRWLGSIFNAEGESLAQALVGSGHAVTYVRQHALPPLVPLGLDEVDTYPSTLP